MGSIMKASLRFNIDNFVNESMNSLEVKITNLWTNRLIGNEHLPKDYKSKGNGIKKWPDWLTNQTKLPSERVTFFTYKHWGKASKLQPSDLLISLQIITSEVLEIK